MISEAVMSYKFTKTLTKVVFGIALACYIAAAYIMNRGGNAVAMLAVASAVLVIGVVIRLIWFRCPKCHPLATACSSGATLFLFRQIF